MLYRYLPPLRWRKRAVMMDFRESFYDAVTDGQSEFADMLRTLCNDMMRQQIPDSPELWEKLTPGYNPGCKRVIISDEYYPAIGHEKTTLETGGIKRVTETGIELENGEVREHDMLVLATGFRTVEFLFPIRITGTQGRELKDEWEGGAHALYGTVVPSLPNFGMYVPRPFPSFSHLLHPTIPGIHLHTDVHRRFYGPNTNLGHNSIILMIEAQSRYLSTLVSAVLHARTQNNPIGLMPTSPRTAAFNAQIQSILQTSSFADPNCGSWYKNKEGRITNNWSGTVIEYQELLSKVDWGDFETTEGGKGAVKESASKVVFGGGTQETKIGRVHEETRVSNAAIVLGVVRTVLAGAAWYAGVGRRVRFGR